MGYFDTLETPVEDIVVGFGLPNDEYDVVLTEVTEVEKKQGGTAVVLKFTVEEGQPLAGKSHQQWLTVPTPDAGDANKRMMFASIMKQWLMNVGVPEGMVGEFDASDPAMVDGILGNRGVLKLRAQKNNPQYQNANFYLDEDSVEDKPYKGVMEPSGNSEVKVPEKQATPEAASPDLDLSSFGV